MSLSLLSFGAQVKVMLRVSRMLSDGQFQPPVLRIDPSRKRVIVIEPPSKNLTHSTMTLGRENRNPLKTFSFDAAYSQDCSQVGNFLQKQIWF